MLICGRPPVAAVVEDCENRRRLNLLRPDAKTVFARCGRAADFRGREIWATRAIHGLVLRMTPKPKFPGIHVEKSPGGLRTISGVATSVAAFVGAARRGRVNKAIRVPGFADFERQFGGLAAGLHLGYAIQQFFLNGGRDAWVVRVAQNADLPRARKGLQALETVDLLSLLALPGVSDAAVLSAAAEFCRRRRAFLVVDSPSSARTPAQMRQAMQDSVLPRTSYGAVYYPWIRIPDPLNAGQDRVTPPSGTVAGLFARIDASRGCWKAPAGTGAILTGVAGLAYNLTDAENGLLDPRGVNCLRIFPASGPVAWGARTLEGDDLAASEWKYVPVRRTALFIEESLSRGLQWAVFEPNGEPLWAQIRLHAALS